MKENNEEIKIKEYPPLIPVKTIMEDKLVGVSTYRTVVKRLKLIGVKVLAFDMVVTRELFKALIPKKKKPIILKSRKSKPFKLR